MAYHGRGLAEDEQERLRSHLTRCPSCVSLVLDLEAFVQPGEAARAALSEFEIALAWRAMKAVLEKEDPAAWKIRPPRTQAADDAPVRRRAAGYRGTVRHLALAASLAAAAVGLTMWSSQHRLADELARQLATLSEPQVNFTIRDIVGDAAVRSGIEAAPQEIPLDVYSSLVIPLSDPRAFDDWEVEILDSAGRTVWGSRGFAPHPLFGTLALGLPPRLLEPGEYRLRVHGWQDGERVLLGDDLRVRAAAGEEVGGEIDAGAKQNRPSEDL